MRNKITKAGLLMMMVFVLTMACIGCTDEKPNENSNGQDIESEFEREVDENAEPSVFEEELELD